MKNKELYIFFKPVDKNSKPTQLVLNNCYEIIFQQEIEAKVSNSRKNENF